MRWFERILLLAVVGFFVWSCGYTSPVASLLDRAEMELEAAPDSAFVLLDSMDRSLLETPELKARHALLYSLALEKVGMDVSGDSIILIAMDYYQRVGDAENLARTEACRQRLLDRAALLNPADTLRMQGAKILEERYRDKTALVEKEHNQRKILILALLAIAALSAVIRIVVRKLRQRPDEKAMAVIRQRLAVLDKVIASRISSDEKTLDSAEEEIDVLMADREAFLRSTKIVFEESHPKFISYLHDKGLTDWEIGYCCLYTLGLKGKDIGEYIQKKRHYIISHEIRQKLGLDEHDTNISIYLRNLLLEQEH